MDNGCNNTSLNSCNVEEAFWSLNRYVDIDGSNDVDDKLSSSSNSENIQGCMMSLKNNLDIKGNVDSINQSSHDEAHSLNSCSDAEICEPSEWQ